MLFRFCNETSVVNNIRQWDIIKKKPDKPAFLFEISFKVSWQPQFHGRLQCGLPLLYR